MITNRRPGLPRDLYLGRRCLERVPAALLAVAPDRVLDAVPASTFRTASDEVAACASGDATFAPPCRPGEIRVGPASLCRALCDPERACEPDFRCVPFRGANVCAPLLASDPTCLAAAEPAR